MLWIDTGRWRLTVRARGNQYGEPTTLGWAIAGAQALAGILVYHGEFGTADSASPRVYATTAPALFRDYRENLAVTTARLADKRVQVSGVVVSLERNDGRNGVAISLASGDAVLPVDMTMLPIDGATLSRVMPNDEVTVQCRQYLFYLESLSGDGCVLK
ncbi:OB-fold protein [Citrobacter freundii]|uniref:OB-fold protein n=1 Tax=Citrobacter freundii TaxID=546 RepID=UPI00300D6BE8